MTYLILDYFYFMNKVSSSIINYRCVLLTIVVCVGGTGGGGVCLCVCVHAREQVKFHLFRQKVSDFPLL